MAQQQDIVIVGAGVIGLACAYYLRKAGREVCVVDQGEVGKGASHANCGLVTPSHALPLTQPGVIAKAMKWMLRPDSPFYIKPELDFAKLIFLLQFARRCNERDMVPAMLGRQALLDSSRSLFDELFAAHQMDCEWRAEGVLFVFKQSAGMHGYEKTNDRLTKLGLGATPITGKALIEREPALLDEVYGAWLYEMDAHMRPDRFMAELRRVVESMGVEVREHFPVDAIDGVKVRGPKGELKWEKLILATGAWSSKLGNMLRCKIPVQPGKGYSITMNQPARPVKIPCLFQEVKMVATPFASGYRLGGTMEFAGFDATLNETRLSAIRRSAAQYLHTPEGDTVTERWYGWRPMTWDGLPIIDNAPGYRDVFIAAGHNMLGLSMAPSTGKLLAELVTGAEPHIDPAPYRYARKFGG